MKLYPDKYEENDFVFFLHIPKTAGTSLTNSLKSAFREDHSLTPFQMNNVRAHPQEIFLNAELLYGHFPHEIYAKRLPKQPNFILTFLRDPVAHYVSTFFHLKMDPTFAYTTRLTSDRQLAEDIHSSLKSASIEDFLKSSHSQMFDNFQTRYLVNGLSSGYHHHTDEQLLPVAQRLLLELPFFGLTERFDDSLQLLQTVLGIGKKLQLLESNKARNKPRNFSPSAEVLTEIQRRTPADSALYDVAQLAFEARLFAHASVVS